MNYQFSKKMSYLLTPPTTNETLAFFQPEKRSYPFEVLLFSTRINCRSQSWVEKRRIYNALFSHEKDPDVHSVELLCNAIHEKNIPSWYEDSLRALSFILVAGMHNSGLIRYLDPHKHPSVSVGMLFKPLERDTHKRGARRVAQDDSQRGSNGGRRPCTVPFRFVMGRIYD